MKFTGSKISIGPLAAPDCLPLFRWLNDTEAARLDLAYRPIDWASHKAWFDTIGRDVSKVLFAIRKIGDTGLVGCVTIAQIQSVHRSAELGVRIGEEKDRGQGYGSEALGLALNFCWRHLNLQRVWLHTFKHNERAIRTYAGAGFKREGVLRRAAYIDGQWVDVVVMAKLRPPSKELAALV
jgi:RimJ/RimL family protein N-acetyltransferase